MAHFVGLRVWRGRHLGTGGRHTPPPQGCATVLCYILHVLIKEGHILLHWCGGICNNFLYYGHWQETVGMPTFLVFFVQIPPPPPHLCPCSLLSHTLRPRIYPPHVCVMFSGKIKRGGMITQNDKNDTIPLHYLCHAPPLFFFTPTPLSLPLYFFV